MKRLNIKQLLKQEGASTIIGAAHALIAEIAEKTHKLAYDLLNF